MTWARQNLFSSCGNALTTVVIAVGLVWALVPLIDWAVLSADWMGTERTDCSKGGACWVYITQRFDQFMYGFYPEAERWRVDIAALILVAAMVLFFWSRVSGLRALVGFVVALFACGFLLVGGSLALPAIETRLWGGMMLTVVLTIAGLAMAFPVAILMALGRRSSLPIVRIFCTAFI